MGQFINEPEKELFNKVFDDYLDATNRYSKQQTSAPVFVDYYSFC